MPSTSVMWPAACSPCGNPAAATPEVERCQNLVRGRNIQSASAAVSALSCDLQIADGGYVLWFSCETVTMQ